MGSSFASFMPCDMLASVQADIKNKMAVKKLVVAYHNNSLGRDFIVGDIHGAFKLVRKAMREVNFNQEHDRLFSCGDLIDRGDESHVAARFLAASFVHAVMGNHENDLLTLYAALDPKDKDAESAVEAVASMNWNGMKWLLDTDYHQRAALLRAFAGLPLVIEIETPRGLAGIIHGEVPIGMTWSEFKRGILANDPSTVESCLSGRKRAMRQDNGMVEGVGRLYCGHTPQFDGATRLGNVFLLDTGAVFSQIPRTQKNHPHAALTIAGICFSTGALADQLPKDQTASPVRVINKGPGTGPFNSSWIKSGD